MTNAPLIDLRSDAPPPVQIRIDGKPYDVARPDDLSPLDLHALNRWHQRVAQLDRAEDWSEADAREHDELVSRFAHLVVPAVPVELLERVGREGREAIIEVFLGARLLQKVQAGLIARGTAALIGSSWRGVSSGTTAETPSDG